MEKAADCSVAHNQQLRSEATSHFEPAARSAGLDFGRPTVDARQILVLPHEQSNESGHPQIYVRPFPNIDSGHWQVSTAGGTRPAWARNGKELFYLAPDGKLMALKVSGASIFKNSPSQPLFDAPMTRFFGQPYDVSADGQRFVAVVATVPVEPQRFNTLLNWSSLVK